MFEKRFDNNEGFRSFLNETFEEAKRIGAKQERAKDYGDEEYVEIEFEINFNKKGFQVYYDNKTFICQNGKQLIEHLKSLGASDGQLLQIQEMLLKERLKRKLK